MRIINVMMNGNELLTLRKTLDLSQQSLAEKIGVDQGTVSKWESGKQSPSGPALKLLKQLAAGAASEAAE